MRKPEWLFVGALLLVGVYFGYRYFSKNEKFNPLSLVPDKTVAVYTTKKPFSIYESLKTFSYWQDILKISEVKEAEKLLAYADSALREQNLTGRLNSRLSFVSLHITGNESAGLMFYLPTGVGTAKAIESMLKSYSGKTPVYTSREYNNNTIHELKAGDLQLTFLNHKNYFIVSTYGYLIEDVVRNIGENFEANFISKNAQVFSVPRLSQDGGDLYINGDQFTAFINTFRPALKPMKMNIGESAFYDINFSNDNLFMSGFLFSESNAEFAAMFKDQEASYPDALKLIPDNAAAVMLVNVSDIQSWYKKWGDRFIDTNEEIGNLRQHTPVRYMNGEIVLATFFSNDETNPDKFLMAKISDKEGVLNMLNKQAEEIVAQNEDSVFAENYADRVIGLVDKPDFVQSFLGTPFNGFPSTYYMIYDDYLVLASSAERIKQWLTDIDEDFVWGRDVDKNELIEESLQEVSFALIYANPWAWSLSRDDFNKRHQTWWLDNEKPIKQIGQLVVQFTNLDNRFYSELHLDYQNSEMATENQQFSDESLTQLTSKLTNRPKLVKNHNNGRWEVLMQDSANNLSLLDNTGELLWTESLGQAIISEVEQVDFYKNRKLQYLFATDSAIHIIDRNGVEIENYPKRFSDFRIKDIFLIDYDHSRNYRFLVSDYSGNLRMFNTDGEQLEGWNPMAFNTELSTQVYHVRVRGKDRIVVGLTNGIIHLRNRRGEEQGGFPFDLAFNLQNPLHFKVGSTFKASRFTTLSSDGMIVQFDLEGNEYARTQLHQPSESSAFSLIIDKVKNDWIIARQDLNRLAVLNKEGNVKFEKDYESASIKEVQYYQFGVDKRLYVVRDSNSGRVYLYNTQGDIVNAGVIYSDYPLSVVYRKKQAKCYIYTARGQTVEVKSFSF